MTVVCLARSPQAHTKKVNQFPSGASPKWNIHEATSEKQEKRVASASFCTLIVGVSSSRPSKCKVDIIAVMTSRGNLWKSGGRAAAAKCCLLDEWEPLMGPRRIRLVHSALAGGAVYFFFLQGSVFVREAPERLAPPLHGDASCCSSIRLGQKSRTGWLLSFLPMCSWAKPWLSHSRPGLCLDWSSEKTEACRFFFSGDLLFISTVEPRPLKFGPDSIHKTQSCLNLSQCKSFSVGSLWYLTL